MATIQVEVVSPEKQLFSGEAEEVYARSLDGEIGILPGHQPALLALDISPVKMKLADGSEERVAVHNGFLFFRENRLVILADSAERAGDIDVNRAQARLRELEGQEQGTDEDDEDLRAARRRQEVRLDVAGR
ncbi:MAG: ATP synthase F1 subunit epsilon [Actinobacteria bacterium]|nr:ATP synthase F1 subunit epsilon [Actinomycetota bacterium]